eukprot:TRINITY_DN9897_c0_g2_i4.p1 TRINITY_DN9897_c0_g2~~TRINITY_DN9897_c0_g2_i4.p1  ORF type:complete len:253 (+),score=81.36 TRINITY_DN9897_c0_g2_i4:94-852(+)
MIRRPPRSTLSSSSAASDVYKRQYQRRVRGLVIPVMAHIEGLFASPPLDSEGKLLRPPHEMVRAFFNRYDLDLSGTMNSSNELKQLTVNLIVNLQLDTTVEAIEQSITGAGALEYNPWDIAQFKIWFFSTFAFSEKEHLAELNSATSQLNNEVEAAQAKLLDAADGSAEQKNTEKALEELAAKQGELAGKLREFNKMEAEQKAKADAALEKKKLAEEARARKQERESKSRNCLLYTSPSPRDRTRSRMPSSA